MTARAKFGGFCSRCNGVINQGDEVALRHGNWIHVECHPGADDQ